MDAAPNQSGVKSLCIYALKRGSMMGNTFEWKAATPESQGMNSNKLNALWDDIEARGTAAFLVIRNDKVILERYAEGWSRTKKHYTASMTKALVGGTSLMLALSYGIMDPDDGAWKYIPQWKMHPQKSKITIRHLATHTSGIKDAMVYTEKDRIVGVPGSDLEEAPGWEGEFWQNRGNERAFLLARDAAQVISAPGTEYHYSNPGMAMLSYAVTKSLQGTAYTDIRSLLRERIMRPIGIPDDEWSCGYGASPQVEGMTMIANWGGGEYSPNATARIGRLIMRKGNWEGNQLVDASSVEKVLSHAGMPGNSGLSWWLNVDKDGNRPWPALPADAFSGAGNHQQTVVVIPSLSLIMVRNGDHMNDDLLCEECIYNHLTKPLMATIDGG
jgi:CubicO group peptidase (beta-lactamase class C family)